MCFIPSCKTLLVFVSLFFITGTIVYVVGPQAALIPIRKVSVYIPTPHISVSFAGTSKIDYAEIFEESGFGVQKGSLVSLHNGTCQQCLGSPILGSPHIAVTFEELPGTFSSCIYNETEKTFCFHLEQNEVVVIVTENPPIGLFYEFSWGVYLYDRLYTNHRTLIQTPIMDPFRPLDEGPSVYMVSYMPELTEAVSTAFQGSWITQNGVHVFTIPTDLVQVSQGFSNNDRISLLLKSLPRSQEKAKQYYSSVIQNTQVLKLSIRNASERALVREGETYSSRHARFSYLEGKIASEVSILRADLVNTIQTYEAILPSETCIRMTVLRDVLREIFGAYDLKLILEKQINGLMEDWDVGYSVSGNIGKALEDGKLVGIFGINHPEATRTTLSIMDFQGNKEIASLPYPTAWENVYVRWISSNCSRLGVLQKGGLCTEMNQKGDLFIRERVYGISSYENMIPPYIVTTKK